MQLAHGNVLLPRPKSHLCLSDLPVAVARLQENGLPQALQHSGNCVLSQGLLYVLLCCPASGTLCCHRTPPLKGMSNLTNAPIGGGRSHTSTVHRVPYPRMKELGAACDGRARGLARTSGGCTGRRIAGRVAVICWHRRFKTIRFK